MNSKTIFNNTIFWNSCFIGFVHWTQWILCATSAWFILCTNKNIYLCFKEIIFNFFQLRRVQWMHWWSLQVSVPPIRLRTTGLEFNSFWGAGRSSEVECSLMVRWVVGSILHRVDPLSYFSYQPVLQDWCNKGRGMCYPVCGMVHIKEPLLLIDKSSLCGGSGFPFSLSEWSLIICLTPYNRR